MNASTPERPALPVPVGDETEALRKLIASQAEDVAPWFFGRTSGEAHLQRELRKLHAAVERLLLARVAGLEAREASLRDALRTYVTEIARAASTLAECDEDTAAVVVSALGYLGALQPGHAEDEVDDAVLTLRAALADSDEAGS